MPKARRRGPLDRHLPLFDHLEMVAEALPSFRPYFPVLEALGLDPAKDAERLGDLVARARRAHVDADVAAARMRDADARALELAQRALDWVGAVRKHLRLAELANPEATAAVAEVRGMLTLRSPRFPGAMAQVRRLVPALAVHASRLDVHPGAARVRAEGEQLHTALGRLERELAERVEELAAAVAASDAAVTEATRHHDAMRQGWDLARATSPSLPKWPFGRRPRLPRRDLRGARMHRTRRDDVPTDVASDADAPERSDAPGGGSTPDAG